MFLNIVYINVFCKRHRTSIIERTDGLFPASFERNVVRESFRGASFDQRCVRRATNQMVWSSTWTHLLPEAQCYPAREHTHTHETEPETWPGLHITCYIICDDTDTARARRRRHRFSVTVETGCLFPYCGARACLFNAGPDTPHAFMHVVVMP